MEARSVKSGHKFRQVTHRLLLNPIGQLLAEWTGVGPISDKVSPMIADFVNL
jgi:hypothetical protein